MTYRKILGYTMMFFAIMALLLILLTYKQKNTQNKTEINDVNSTSTGEVKGDGKIEIKDAPKDQASQIKTQTKIKIIIFGNTFDLELPEGKTGFDAILVLASSSKITFHSVYYSGLGNFVDEINGVKSNSQNYWIWYLNGMKANIGISNYKIKTGDVIEWKYEKAE